MAPVGGRVEMLGLEAWRSMVCQGSVSWIARRVVLVMLEAEPFGAGTLVVEGKLQ